MIDLYAQDEQHACDRIKQSLKDEILKNQTPRPSKINEYHNLFAYQNFKDNHFAARVNQMFLEYGDYLDSKRALFQKDFAKNHHQRISELIAADFLVKNGFKLQTRAYNKKGIADLEFKCNSQQYYMECTTRASTLLSDYIEINKNFDAYYEIAVILDGETKEYNRQYPRLDGKWYYCINGSDCIWESMNEDVKQLIWNKLGNSLPRSFLIHNAQFIKFLNWVYYNRYALAHFKNLLPDSLIQKLATIFPGEKKIPFAPKQDYKFIKAITKFVAQGICDKLKNACFRESEPTPVTIFISLASLPDWRMMCPPSKLLLSIAQSLPEVIIDVVDEKSKKDKNFEITYQKSIKRLYAIIIDTTCYNAFAEELGAHMPEGYTNVYGVIYNISQELTEKIAPDLFSEVILYRYNINLNG